MFQTSPDSAPHQVVELRSLRDINVAKDFTQSYTRTRVESSMRITYHNYFNDSLFHHAQGNGDKFFQLHNWRA